MLVANVDLPLFVLPIINIVGTYFTSFGTASFCSRVLGLRIVNYLYY